MRGHPNVAKVRAQEQRKSKDIKLLEQFLELIGGHTLCGQYRLGWV